MHLRIIAFAAFAASSTAYASEPLFPHRLEVGLQGGAFLPAKNHELFNPAVARQRMLRPFGLNIGARFAYFPLSFLGAELEGAMVPLRLENGSAASLFTLQGHAVLQLPYQFTPFAIVGGGALSLRSADRTSGDDADPSFHWGLGLKYRAMNNVDLRIDARHIVSASEGRGNTDHFQVLTGVTYRFEAMELPAPRAIFKPAPLVVAEPPPVVVPEVQPQVAELVKAIAVPPPETQAQLEAALERVHFNWGSSKLRADASAPLEEAFMLLEKYPSLSVEIRGHTDSTGPERFNMKLSRRRAETVKGYLVNKGIQEERLVTRGFGPHEPLLTNRTPKGRARNRRSEIFVVDEETAPVKIKPVEGNLGEQTRLE